MQCRYRGHEAAEYGGPHGGDHCRRVPPLVLRNLRVCLVEGHRSPLRHARAGPLRQARQM